MTPAKTVRLFLDRMEAKAFNDAVQLIAADCVYTNLPIGTVQGPEGVLATLEPFFAAIEQNEFQVLRMAEAGDVVFVERLDRHRTGQGWWELPVTGVFEVRGGLIRVWREYFDLATMQRGMGGGA
jgi:limonene-1,2-epoxide hydrolase